MAENEVQYLPDGTTWQPATTHGKLGPADQEMLLTSVFAFPEQRELPLTDADHVLAAVAHLNQVEGVDERDRALARANIWKAAEHYEVDLTDDEWQEYRNFSE